MTNYNKFYKFYDQVMGDREKSSRDILAYIGEYSPNAKKVLELACGTGAVLKFLAEKYDTHGLDLSEGMLSVAAEKVPNATLYHQSMVDFQIDEKFDVIICVFDSINHLLDFNDWKKVFENVGKHLNPGGLFIFDVTTEDKLQRFVAEPPWVKPFDGNIMIMDVQDAGSGIVNWDIKVFEKKEGSMYELHEENIYEISFPMKQIENELKKIFDTITIKDKMRRSELVPADSVYFICKS